MNRFLMTTALAAGPVLFSFAITAHADCNAVGGFADGDTITCDSTSVIDGPDAIENRELEVDDNDVDNLTFILEDNAVIDTTAIGERAIRVRKSDDVTVTLGNNARINSGMKGLRPITA